MIDKSGAWFAYNGDKIGQGRENAKLYLAEHPELLEEMEQKIRAHYHFNGARRGRRCSRRRRRQKDAAREKYNGHNRSGAAIGGPKRYKVYLDGKLAFVLIQRRSGKISYGQKGSEIPEETCRQIRREVVLKRARMRALHLLNDMGRTEAQLRAKLRQNHYTGRDYRGDPGLCEVLWLCQRRGLCPEFH